MQITAQIHGLKLPFQVETPAGMVLDRFVYVYLICGQSLALIDCGVKGHEQAILQYVEKLGRKPSDIKTIILTHSHPDHLGAAAALQQAAGARILAHPAERVWIEDTELQFRQRPVPGFHKLVGGPVTVDGWLADGQIINLEGELSLEVLHTPGHSAGSICLYMPGTGALFSADSVPVPGDVPIYDDVQGLWASLQRLRGVADVIHLLSAWDEPRHGREIELALTGAMDYVRRVQAAVERPGDSIEDPLAWCRAILLDLGIPPQAANPLVLRTFQAHLKTIGLF